MARPRSTVVHPAGSRPSLDTGLGNHEARTRAIERQKPAATSRVALFRGLIDAAASTSQQYFSMDADDTIGVTNDEGLYVLKEGAGLAAGFFGPAVTEYGLYRVTYSCTVIAGTVGDKITQYYGGDPIGRLSNWFQGHDTITILSGPINHEIGVAISFAEVRAVGGPLADPQPALPMGEVPYVQNNTGARTFSADCSVLLEKLADDYTTDLIPGSNY